MDLATHQRKLLGLIRSPDGVCLDDDEYICRVARSGDLAEARRNILLWRIFVLERTCVLTFTLLKRRHLLEETVSAFIAQQNISPFRETQGPAFLEMVSGHHDTLIASVAQFELALMRVRAGDPSLHEIAWDVDPHVILHRLARDLPIDEPVSKGAWQAFVSGTLPSLFQIVRGADPTSSQETQVDELLEGKGIPHQVGGAPREVLVRLGVAED
jgi:hypothetical protein